MATSVFADTAAQAYTAYEAELTFTDTLMAGIPGNPKLIEGWLRGQAGIDDADERRQLLVRTLIDIGVDLPATATWEEIEKASEEMASQTQTCVFKRNGQGLYLESRNVKAALKEAANIAYPNVKWKLTNGLLRKADTGGKLLKSHLAERVFVETREILLGREQADDVHLQIGHHFGPRGPQSSLGYHEVVFEPVLEFRVLVDGDCVPADVWANVWTRCEENGIGALRSQAHGTFKVTRWDRME